jgi:signal transduction histidine kinase
MDKETLIKLREQIDIATEAGTSEAYTALATSLANALKRLGRVYSTDSPTEDEIGRVLDIIEDAWFNGSQPPAELPGSSDQRQRLTRLVSDMLALQAFALSMSRGDLSSAPKITGLMAGSFKALQADLRHLTWQTRMIAKGDLSQRVEFMGEFSESFNTMVNSLAEARDRLKRDAEELSQANERLMAEISKSEETEKALQLTLSDLERSNNELQQFAYVASHDLQEPLRMIASYIQLLERRYRNRLDKDADDFIAFAVDGAKRMQRLINDILRLSRLGTQAKSMETTHCETVLQQALSNLRSSVEDCGAQVTYDPLPVTTADPTQLVQLLQNIIGNAIKFRGKDDPHIHVSAQAKGNEWLLSVSDNGIGIDPEHSDRIFGIFQRLHGRGEYSGTGIGLAICRKIVEGHGGKIWVQSEPGKGATFFFTLPRDQGVS